MPKGFFRRAAALGCALLLCGGRALAEEFYTINEVRQQAAAGWHETYRGLRAGRSLRMWSRKFRTVDANSH